MRAMESSYSKTESLTKDNKQRREREPAWPKKKKDGGSSVTLEGYIEPAEGGCSSGERGPSDCGGGEGVVGRTKSLTEEDLEELKGCLDLGFGFSYDEIPELCSTLPALELCYSMSQRLLDDHHDSSPATPLASWKFSSPGDDPEEVKARLKYWAQAVACTVKLCS